tara:strand:- start:5216 stop:5623 length:408 start_codon:yes stop_codon:yes gene_type:complete
MASIEEIRTKRKQDKEVMIRIMRACTVLMTSMNISAQELKWERGKSKKVYDDMLETLILKIAECYRELEKIKIETQSYKDNYDKRGPLPEKLTEDQLVSEMFLTKDDDEVYLMECSPEEFTNHMMDKLSDAQQGG